MNQSAKPVVVCFAGVPGSSKTIIAHHLSVGFRLPIFSTDTIRFEVREDLRVSSINLPEALREYNRRHDARWQQLMVAGQSFILDASVDRRWETVRSDLLQAGYRWYVVDMELSRRFLIGLYESTGRHQAVEELGHYLEQHEAFMKKYASDVNLQITDTDFSDRCKLAETGLHQFLRAK